MTDGFWSSLNQKLIYWSGWVFTVGGAIAALIVGKEYSWIGGLVVLVGLLALMTFAHQKHREKIEADALHRAELDRVRSEHQTEKQHLQAERDTAHQGAEDAERRLNEIPSDMLVRLQEIIRSYAFGELAIVLAEYASYVERMQALTKANPKPVNLRSFVKRGPTLYALAGLNAIALECLRDSDRFELAYKDPNGLLTVSARLVVHQQDAAKELVWFEVTEFRAAEMAHVDSLAEKQVVPAKGYTAQPICDLTRYTNVGLANVGDVIRSMVEEMAREHD